MKHIMSCVFRSLLRLKILHLLLSGQNRSLDVWLWQQLSLLPLLFFCSLSSFLCMAVKIFLVVHCDLDDRLKYSVASLGFCHTNQCHADHRVYKQLLELIALALCPQFHKRGNLLKSSPGGLPIFMFSLSWRSSSADASSGLQ